MPQLPTASPSLPNLFRMISTDIHFWIPFTVLIGGLVLLDKVR
jgi:hypothetical protein